VRDQTFEFPVGYGKLHSTKIMDFQLNRCHYFEEPLCIFVQAHQCSFTGLTPTNSAASVRSNLFLSNIRQIKT
jgi:hypothetical protein